MRELPAITPRVQRPKPVALDPHGYTLMPCGHCGPVALVLSRKPDGGKVVTLASAEALAAITTEDGADLSRLRPEDMCDVALVGWPEDWHPGHVAWGLIDAMATALVGGLPWATVSERALAAHLRSKANLN